jgi:cytochrome c
LVQKHRTSFRIKVNDAPDDTHAGKREVIRMSSMELNKIVAAVLLAGVIAMTTGFLAELLVAPEELIENAYLVETGADEAAPAEEEEEQVPLAVLLANADPAEGESSVRACASCHTFEQGGADRIGPHLWGVVGRAKGGVEGFGYSSAMEAAEGDWTYEALDGFLHQPRDYLPGTSMSYAGIRDPEDRANVIAYMRTLSEDPLPLPEPPAEEAAAEEDGAAAEGAGEQPAGEAAEEEAATAAPPAEPAGAEPAEAGEEGAAGEAAAAEEAADEAEADAATAATEGGVAAEEAAADAETDAEVAEREAEHLAETGGPVVEEAEDAAIDAEQAAGQAERAAEEAGGEAAPGQQPGDLAPGTAEDEIEYRRDEAFEPEAAADEAAEPELLEEETGEALSEGAAEETGLGPARGAPTEVDPNFVPVPEDADVGERLYEPAVPGSMADEPGPVGMTPEEGAEADPLEPPVETQEGLDETYEVEVGTDPDAVVPVEPGEPGEDITEEVVPADRGPPE